MSYSAVSGYLKYLGEALGRITGLGKGYDRPGDSVREVLEVVAPFAKAKDKGFPAESLYPLPYKNPDHK